MQPIPSNQLARKRASSLPELGIGLSGTIPGAAALVAPELRIEGPRSIFLAANGGLGDLCLALQVLLAFRAELADPEQHEWVVAMPSGWGGPLRPIIEQLGVFDAIGHLEDAKALLAGLAHDQLILPSLLAGNDDDARLALASTAGYLWARWGMATPFQALRGSPAIARLRAQLAPRFQALGRELGLPAPGAFSVLAPEASYLGGLKAWPLAHWRELIASLQHPTSGLPRAVVICASPESFARIRDGLGPDVHHFDYTDPRLNSDLSNLASVVAAAAFTISLDSGTAHLASLLEAPCVSLWGPTSPVIYASPNTTALRTSLCPPCSTDARSSICQTSVCMANLSPHTVVRVLQRLSIAPHSHSGVLPRPARPGSSIAPHSHSGVLPRPARPGSSTRTRGHG